MLKMSLRAEADRVRAFCGLAFPFSHILSMLVDIDRMVSSVWGSGGERGPRLGDVGSQDISGEVTESEVRRRKSMIGCMKWRVKVGRKDQEGDEVLIYRVREAWFFSMMFLIGKDAPRRLS